MKFAAILLLTASLAIAQAPGAEQIGPPACIALRKPAAHPSPADILQTQEKGTADPTVVALPEPVGNMGILRYQVRDYADCTGANGCYWADLDAQTKRAAELLENAVKTAPKSSKKALILDIDETSLSSYCEEVQEDFGYIPDRFEAWIVSKDASIAIAGTVALARKAQAAGVDVFFITGRPEAQRQATEQNLHSAGYGHWKHLSLRQPSDAGRPTADYKSAERAKIAAEGYTLLLNMGDQWSDLQGAPVALHSVKLPNPFYYLP
jgi:hypothetical protein